MKADEYNSSPPKNEQVKGLYGVKLNPPLHIPDLGTYSKQLHDKVTFLQPVLSTTV